MRDSALLKYYYTLRHVKYQQITLRIWGSIKRILSAKVNIYALTEPEERQSYFPLQYDYFNFEEAMLAGRFNFLNTEVNLSWPPDWQSKDVSLLWLFNLNYFYFLEHLSPTTSRFVLHDWIKKNKNKQDIAWHPYPTSIRLSSWIKCGIFDQTILDSMADQVEYLHNNIEWYHPANHMIENMKAIIHFALVFPRYERSTYFLTKLSKPFLVEVDKQLREDGAHFELSPMYHIQVITILLDLYQAADKHRKFKEAIETRLLKMARYLKSILHPDGKIPLLNDSVFANVPTARTILRAIELVCDSKVRELHPAELLTYTVFKNNIFFLIYDNMEVGPDNIPAHAHSDTFSYELSIYGERIIVDSGVYEYQAGARRDLDRHSSAHNSLTVDGTGPINAWSSFRVAQRTTPKTLYFLPNSKLTSVIDNYYGVIGKLSHIRELTIDENEIRIADQIESTREHEYVSHIHFHPDVKYIASDRNEYCYKKGDVEFRIVSESGVAVRSNSTYSPKFGLSIDRELLTLTSKSRGLTTISYKVCF